MHRRLFSSSSAVISQVYRLHHAPIIPITLKSLISRGPIPPTPGTMTWDDWIAENEHKIVSSAQHLHHEIPIRLASRIVDLESLPSGLANAPSVKSLREMLLNSFEEMVESDIPKDLESERSYMAMQLSIRERHSKMHSAIQDAILLNSNIDLTALQAVLDQFYSSRIGIRMMVDQHLALQKDKPGYVGLIQPECCPMTVTRNVIDKMSDTASFHDVHIVKKQESPSMFQYMPSHLSIILTEVLKYSIINASESEKSSSRGVEVQVAGGEQGVSIKVSNASGGVHWEDVPKIWSYDVSTAETSNTCRTSYDPVAVSDATRGSIGDSQKSLTDSAFGMPIARLYARYFGGEVTVMPMEGYGTDVYIHLKKLSDNSPV